MTQLTSRHVLDEYFLEARCKLLDVAAILDRIERGDNSGAVDDDPRMIKIRQAIEALNDPGMDRAERIQQIFSLAYDENWTRPQPR